MHILLGILGVLSAAMIWYWRVKQVGEAASELTNAANDVRLAIKRFGYMRGRKTHPEDAVRRLTKIIRRKAGAEAGPDLISMVEKVATADGIGLDERETDALEAIRRGLGMA